VGTDQSGSGITPLPASLSDMSSNIIGGNIIGVGSKIDKPSMINYDHANKYLLFEFVWDPSKDTIALGQAGGGIGQPIGQTPFGQQPGQPPNNPQNPPQNPQQPPNPQQ
jgi:hypothetical protein